MNTAATYSPGTVPVPSAMGGLTSLFGMGRGGHPRYNHHKDFVGRLQSAAFLFDNIFDISGTDNRFVVFGRYPEGKKDQSLRAISTARLRLLPALHLRPIDAVVSCGP